MAGTTKAIADIQVGDLIRPKAIFLFGADAVLTVVGIIDGTADSRFLIGAHRPAGSDKINTVAGPFPTADQIETAPGFGCPHCLRVSHHPSDQAERWCDACGIFWPRFTATRRERA